MKKNDLQPAELANLFRSSINRDVWVVERENNFPCKDVPSEFPISVHV